MPPNPTASRVAVWRQLKKIGAIYLQQSVCVFPQNSALRKELTPILDRITGAKGTFHLLPLRRLSPDEEAKLIEQFVNQTSNHYQEIIEDCEVNFAKEIEFETFRKNFTYEEAEEIRSEFEKICTWFERVRQRAWFGAPNEAQAKASLDRCESMLEEFEAKVFALQQTHGDDGTAATAARRRARRSRSVRLRAVGGKARAAP